MSLPTVEQLSPVLALGSARNFAIENGGMESNYLEYTAQNPSTQNITVPISVPAMTTVLDPTDVMANITYKLVFTAAGNAGNVLNIGATDAPRQWPFHQTCAVMNMNINGTDYATSVQQWFPAAIRMGMWGREANSWSTTTPSKQDYFQEYYDAGNPNQALSPLNPLLDYNGSGTDSVGRGATPIQVAYNNSTGAELTFSSYERLLCSPLFPNTEGISGIQTMTFSCTMSPLQRVWCHGNDPARSTITSLTVTIERFSIRCRFITPKAGTSLPQRLILPYINWMQFQTAPITLTPTSSTSINTGSINLASIPRYVILWVKEADTNTYGNTTGDLWKYTDTALRIDQIKCTFNNRSNVLAELLPYDLFRMSSRNGLNVTWPDWFGSITSSGAAYGGGSFVIINVANDIALPNDLAPGVGLQTTMQFTVTCTNFGSQTRNAQVTTLLQYCGVTDMEAPGRPLNSTTSPLTKEDVVAAAFNPIKEIGEYEGSERIVGGRFNLVKSIGRVVRKGARLAKKHHLISRGIAAAGGPAAASELADMLGYGLQSADTGRSLAQNYIGGARSRPRPRRRVLTGGTTLH